jgi:hypothetical protein
LDRNEKSAVAQMKPTGDGKYHVHVYGPDDTLLAKAPEPLSLSLALNFVDDTVGKRFIAHFHWEERAKQQKNKPA